MTFTATVDGGLARQRHADRHLTFYDGTTTLGTGSSAAAWPRYDDRIPVERGQRPVDHGGLRRRRQLHDQHVHGADPDGQPGQHDHVRRLLGESVGLRAAGDLHGDRDGQLARQRDADRHRHLLCGSTTLGTGTLSGGVASFTTTSPLAAGNDTIKASYGGDTNFKTSSGTLTQTVNQDSTTTSVVSSANPSVYGQSVTFTATVTANAPGSGTPTRLGHVHERLDDAGHGHAERRHGLL